MPRATNVILDEKSSYALRPQQKLGPYDFPFTLNPTIGCFFGCKYCYSPFVTYPDQPDQKQLFFDNVHVKLDKPAHLATELQRYSVLPQHMKRVQINETSEYYLPQVLKHLKDHNKPDLMLGILNEFQKAWSKGNQWMLHILTKSHLILNHLDKLKEMKEMVQVEVSFATNDEEKRKRIEYYTTTTDKRLDLVKQLSDAGIFVRIMAMPFWGGKPDLDKLKEVTFARGAKAFKNKGLNYYSNWDDLAKEMEYEDYLQANIPTGVGRVDQVDVTVIRKSGEPVLSDGKLQTKNVLMPQMDTNFRATSNWSAIRNMGSRFAQKDMQVIDYGYRDCNSVDWGYIT